MNTTRTPHEPRTPHIHKIITIWYYLAALKALFARFLVCVVVYYCSDIKICGEGGGAGGRAADQRGAGAAAAARHLGLQRAESKICSTDWNRLRVCRSALVETWPMLGLSC